MSNNEKICRVLVARKKWKAIHCQLCRRIARDKCKILQEQSALAGARARQAEEAIRVAINKEVIQP